jgi:predicted DCC family thiol-disulfide oxidoreductase YuxK
MLIAIYDGHCVICNTTRRIVTALDWFSRVRWVDLHNRTAALDAYPALDLERAMGEIHLVDGPRLFTGFNATRRLLRAVPLGVPLWAILRLPVIGSWLGPRMYRFIARNRYAINRLLGVDLANDPADDCVDGVCKIPGQDGAA